jgi:surfactin synthase thioesterase subunit
MNLLRRYIHTMECLTKFIVTKRCWHIFLPILRADFGLHESYSFNEAKKQMFECNVSVLFGNQDKSVESKEVMRWKEYCSKSFEWHEFNDSHFFLTNYKTAVIDVINNKINKTYTHEFQRIFN